eukprot:TRINITY_DN27806_c0_g1_i1.p1 TRINITY_DN27806_c0_g1~~TRINITY_DN27806_c0_g1_i1.p1  ORF type:complete len:284 (+),score=40.56 TRINITY_DN27806_c0_g1_i1:99-950(+)
MAVGTYTQKTLNDQWFEDRQQPPGALSATGGIHLKQARKYETDIAYIGERYDVLNRISRIPPRPSFAMPDDGFRKWEKTSLVDFAHPRTRKEFVAKPPEKPRLITTESVPEVSYEERRPLPGSKRGFGSVLNRHEENHDMRFWSTTSGDFFGEGTRRFHQRSEPSLRRPAGVSTEDTEHRAHGVQVGLLTGEKFNDSNDAASNTRTQRAWLYQSDPSLTNVHLGGTKPRPSVVDNALSLPLGEGAMSKVRADLKERKGRLYRTATTVTKGLGERSGINIFQDG